MKWQVKANLEQEERKNKALGVVALVTLLLDEMKILGEVRMKDTSSPNISRQFFLGSIAFIHGSEYASGTIRTFGSDPDRVSRVITSTTLGKVSSMRCISNHFK